MPAEDISFLCRWHWLPIFLGLGALVRKQPSMVWTPVTLELISLPISCSIWVMANLLCVSGERCLLCYSFALWLANYFLLKLGQPIAFFCPLSSCLSNLSVSIISWMLLSMSLCFRCCVPWVLGVPAICLSFDYLPSTVQNGFWLLPLPVIRWAIQLSWRPSLLNFREQAHQFPLGLPEPSGRLTIYPW